MRTLYTEEKSFNITLASSRPNTSLLQYMLISKSPVSLSPGFFNTMFFPMPELLFVTILHIIHVHIVFMIQFKYHFTKEVFSGLLNLSCQCCSYSTMVFKQRVLSPFFTCFIFNVCLPNKILSSVKGQTIFYPHYIIALKLNISHRQVFTTSSE